MFDALLMSLAWSADANRASANLGNDVANAGDGSGEGVKGGSALFLECLCRFRDVRRFLD
jgi:hypothetical protein